jgi:plastocyanin
MISRNGALITVALAAWVAVAAASCGGSAGYGTTPTPMGGTGSGGGTSAADVTVDIKGMNGSNSFAPDSAEVAVGKTVAWHNADSMTHTATGRDFNTGPIAPGATSAPIAFDTAATFDYRCTLHPSMTGKVKVGGSNTEIPY